jgi:hypothetical protein
LLLALLVPNAANAAQHPFTDAEILAMAGNKYASGELPLGDKRYVTDAPRKGYIYLCRLMNENGGGAGADGPWIHGTSWNMFKKLYIQGEVYWNDARFSSAIENQERKLSGNGFPSITPPAFSPCNPPIPPMPMIEIPTASAPRMSMIRCP